MAAESVPVQINYDPQDPVSGLNAASAQGRLNEGWKIDDSGTFEAFGDRYAYLETGNESLQQKISESFYNSGLLVVDAQYADGRHVIIIPEEQLETINGEDLAQVASCLDQTLPKTSPDPAPAAKSEPPEVVKRLREAAAAEEQDRLDPTTPGEEFKEPPPPTPPPTLG